MASTPTFFGHGHQFTSTLTNPTIGIALIIVTAVFFFIVLTWYNVFLALYNYIVNTPPPLTEANPRDSNHYYEENKRTFLRTLGFAIAWTLLAVGIYIMISYFHLLHANHNEVIGHPSLREGMGGGLHAL